jgi:hypothetical protein
MIALLPLRPTAVAVGVMLAIHWSAANVAADAYCCATPEPVIVVVDQPVPAAPQQPSWIFAPSTFTHDPTTGARVAQYMRKPPVEPLDDPRAVTSRYRRTRTNLRGADGSYETDYQVQSWGNGRGGIDAEWERFHDAWKESFLTGGYYNGPAYGGYPGYGGGYPGWGYGAPGYGYGFPGIGVPGYGGPGYGAPSYGPPGYGVPGDGHPPNGFPTNGYPPNGYPPNGPPQHSPGAGSPWHPHGDASHKD